MRGGSGGRMGESVSSKMLTVLDGRGFWGGGWVDNPRQGWLFYFTTSRRLLCSDTIISKLTPLARQVGRSRDLYNTFNDLYNIFYYNHLNLDGLSVVSLYIMILRYGYTTY